ncbi:hypothetical protein BKA70DRAFT_1395450 [Coprinopsis sp. MPI-PUGE-AT-0042]|nr:hypothetical protein BKA70DRAFT_1395450 [Coprinopsis sp. MPI-PUGE-AT-0042]
MSTVFAAKGKASVGTIARLCRLMASVPPSFLLQGSAPLNFYIIHQCLGLSFRTRALSIQCVVFLICLVPSGIVRMLDESGNSPVDDQKEGYWRRKRLWHFGGEELLLRFLEWRLGTRLQGLPGMTFQRDLSLTCLTRSNKQRQGYTALHYSDRTLTDLLLVKIARLSKLCLLA